MPHPFLHGGCDGNEPGPPHLTEAIAQQTFYVAVRPSAFSFITVEHGAIVLLYNCADGCADEVAAAQTMIDALPVDLRCVDPVRHQVILAPDPALPTRWAAVAWGHSLAAGCFTAPAFRAFYDANLAHGGEDLCADGADLAPDTCQ